MNWIYRFDRKYGRKFGIPQLILYVTATMLAVWLLDLIMTMGGREGGLLVHIVFWRDAIFAGQVWRIITFLFVPYASDVLYLVLGLVCAYFIGSALENAWGSCLFTLYYILGWLGAIAAGLITGFGTNTYLNLSMLLAYAYLFPDNQFLLFFIIPFKAKWLGYVYGVLLLISFIQGALYQRVAILMSLLNFIVFFGPPIVRKMRENYKYSKTRKAYRNQWNNDRWG